MRIEQALYDELVQSLKDAPDQGNYAGCEGGT